MHTYWTSMFWSIDSCQNQCFNQLTVVKTGYPLTSITWPYRGLRCRPIEVKYFLKLSADKLLVFKWSQAQVQIHMKYVVFMCPTIKILISNWPRTRKFSQLLQAGETVTFDFSHHVHALRSIFMLWLVKIWQVSSFRKFMQHLESCLLWQLKLTEFCVNLWCF